MRESLQRSHHLSLSQGQIANQASAAAVFEAFGRIGDAGFGGSEPKSEVSSMKPVKRYVERRHWLHPIWSFWRIHAFLLLALHVRACIEFQVMCGPCLKALWFAGCVSCTSLAPVQHAHRVRILSPPL